MTSSDDQTPYTPERRHHRRRQKRTPRPFRHDRRSGFDRRSSEPGGVFTQALRQLRDSRSALIGVLVAINLLNVLDLLLTFRLLGDGAVEGNPIMRALIGNDPIVALFVKIALVMLVTLELWRRRRYWLILATSLLVLFAFIALTVYELAMVLAH